MWRWGREEGRQDRSLSLAGLPLFQAHLSLGGDGGVGGVGGGKELIWNYREFPTEGAVEAMWLQTIHPLPRKLLSSPRMLSAWGS